jgi:hypothetical protein
MSDSLQILIQVENPQKDIFKFWTGIHKVVHNIHLNDTKQNDSN